MLPDNLQAARFWLIRERSYLAAALWAVKPIERPGLKTMGVDAWWRLYYDPCIADEWTVKQIGGVLYHEILHLLRDHAGRCKSLNAEKALWNKAADIEVNDDLINEGVELPGSPLLPATYRLPEKIMAEQYYELLSEKGRKEDCTDVFACPSPGMGNCGSCAHGQREAWEDEESQDISQTEAALIRRQVAHEIREACRKRGNVPGHMQRWAELLLSPKVDWRRVLSGAVKSATSYVSGAVDYSYARPSRRQGQTGDGKIVLPTLRRPCPEVAVVVDTSGSMGQHALSQALVEVRGVLSATGIGATVLAVDAAVHTCKRVFDARRVRLEGGGGTDMGVGIAEALRLKPRPQVVVVLTDGYTSWPNDAPPVKVVVVVLGDGPEPPSWAKVVRIAEVRKVL